MIERPSVDWFALAPILAPLAATAVVLLGSVSLPRRLRKPFAAAACALGFAGGFVAAALLFGFTDESAGVIGDAMRRDRLAAFAQMLVAAVGLLAIGVSYGDDADDEGAGEYYALLAAAGAGMAFFASANNLMTLFLGLEWFSICLYVLSAIRIDAVGSLEAGLKYLIVGGFGSAILLFGSALVYGATGELGFEAIAGGAGEGDVLLVFGLAMIVAGLGFKASAAPFHMWTPDAYEGAPTPVTAFMAAATKAVALVLVLRVLSLAFPEEEELWTAALAAIACLSLAVGNLAALVQRNVKRMLAYSSISHAGFMLIPIAAHSELGAKALLYYLIPYCAMSVGAFAVVAARERELRRPVTLDALAGFGWERPVLGVAMWAFMLGLAGFPPTGGFVGKLYAFSAAYDAGSTWLVIVGVVGTLVSLYYYLAVIRAMYMRPAAELQLAPVGGSPPRERLLTTSVVAALAITVASFFAVQPLIELAEQAAAALPFGAG